MVEPPQHENWQGDERRPIGPRDDVSGRRQFAHVELDLTNHAAKSSDLWLDGNDFRIDAFDGNRSISDRGGVRVFGYRDAEADSASGHCFLLRDVLRLTREQPS